MKSFFVIPSVLVLFSIFTISLHAQSTANLNNFTEVKRNAIASREAQKAKFRDDIAIKIKDTRRKQALTALDTKISSRSAAWITHWRNVTDRLTVFVGKLEARANALQGEGKDVSAALTSITAARSAIANAETAINEYELKDYTVSIDTEDTLRQSAQSLITLFKTDVATVIAALTEARRVVAEAFQVLSTIS